MAPPSGSDPISPIGGVTSWGAPQVKEAAAAAVFPAWSVKWVSFYLFSFYRRQIMNVGTLLMEEACYRQEKTIGAQLILSCDLIDISG